MEESVHMVQKQLFEVDLMAVLQVGMCCICSGISNFMRYMGYSQRSGKICHSELIYKSKSHLCVLHHMIEA